MVGRTNISLKTGSINLSKIQKFSLSGYRIRNVYVNGENQPQCSNGQLPTAVYGSLESITLDNFEAATFDVYITTVDTASDKQHCNLMGSNSGGYISLFVLTFTTEKDIEVKAEWFAESTSAVDIPGPIKDIRIYGYEG